MTTKTKPEVQHSPTPWKLQGFNGRSVVTEEGQWVAGFDSCKPEDRAFIVKCVNSHSALVEALSHAVKNNERFDVKPAWYEPAIAALSLASGKSEEEGR